MRGPIQLGVPSGTGTQAETYISKCTRANNKINQNMQHNMELEHAQQTINVTNINLIPTIPHTNSFYNSWGDTLPADPKLAGTV